MLRKSTFGRVQRGPHNSCGCISGDSYGRNGETDGGVRSERYRRVGDIKVTGNNRVEPETVRTLFEIPGG